MANHSTISSLCQEAKLEEDIDGHAQDAIKLIYSKQLQTEASIVSSIPGSGNNFQKDKDLPGTPKTSFTAPQRKRSPSLKESPPSKALSVAISKTGGKINKNVQWFLEMEEKIRLSAKKDHTGKIENDIGQPMKVSANLNQESKDMANKTVNCTRKEFEETRMELTDEICDNKVEKDDIKIFIVFAGRNPLPALSLDTSSKGLVDSGMEDPIEHILKYNIIQLLGSPRAAYHMTRYSTIGTTKFPTFLVFLNPSGIRYLPRAVIKYENLAVLRLNDGGENEKFQDRPPESLPYQIFPPELMDIIKNPRLLPRLIFKVAMDSIAEEVSLCSFNRKNAAKALLLKKVLAAEFRNDHAAHLFEIAAAALCRGKAPISFCRSAGLELLSQILRNWSGRQIKISDFAASDFYKVITSLTEDVPDSFESVLSEYESKAERERSKYFEGLFSYMEKRGDGQGSDILKAIDDAYRTPRVQPNNNKTVTVYDKQTSVVNKVDDDIIHETSDGEESDWSASYIEKSLKEHKPSYGKLNYYREKKSN